MGETRASPFGEKSSLSLDLSDMLRLSVIRTQGVFQYAGPRLQGIESVQTSVKDFLNTANSLNFF